jgi:branched-subunit amino acid transport protein
LSNIEIWLVILGGMVVTYVTRLSFTVLVPPERLPPTFIKGLIFIPPAVLAAIVLPELVLMDGKIAISPANHQLVAGILAAFVAWRLKNTWIAIATGMVALWLLNSL